LCDLRLHLREMVKKSPLMDEQEYAIQVEGLYRQLMQDV